MNALKKLFTESDNVMRDSYIWNTLSATFFAVQSMIALIVITHTSGQEDAGIFSIAYAVGSLMYYIGEYGVRKYQVSDVNEEMTFTDYHSHRLAACAVMLLVISVLPDTGSLFVSLMVRIIVGAAAFLLLAAPYFIKNHKLQLRRKT